MVGPASSGIRVTLDSREPQAIDGERKTVTALFADIKGSTELMRDLDPEEASAVIDPVLRLMIEAVHRYEGFVAQSTGDGIFALFGAPIAHEDHPQRALHAEIFGRQCGRGGAPNGSFKSRGFAAIRMRRSSVAAKCYLPPSVPLTVL